MNSRVFYLDAGPPQAHPQRGGPKMTQRHIRLLNAAGIPAYYVSKSLQRWWVNEGATGPEDIPHVTLNEALKLQDPQKDIWVFSELGTRQWEAIPGKNKVIFSQNFSYAFMNYPVNQSPRFYPWQAPDLKAIITVSEHNQALMQLAAPTAPVYFCPYGIDPAPFQLRSLADKLPLVVTGPDTEEKNQRHLRILTHTFKARHLGFRDPLGNVAFESLHCLPPEQVQRLLSNARIFVFLSQFEGFGLLPVEAMLSGTVVLGFDLAPMNSYLPPAYRFPVGDMAALLAVMEAVLAGKNLDHWQVIADQARQSALGYTLEAEAKAVVGVWQEILGQVGASVNGL